MRTAVFTSLFMSLLFLFPGIGFARNPQIGSILDSYYDALLLSGDAEREALSIVTLGSNRYRLLTKDHPWNEQIKPQKHVRSDKQPSPFQMEWLEQRMLSSWNSYYPSGMNDFQAWQGAGANIWADGGMRFHATDFVDLTVNPRFAYSENERYPAMEPAVGEYGYFIGAIDWPQRFGDDAFMRASLGESEIRFSCKSVSFGAGNQSIWMGPSRFNPLIMGTNAGGFPHLDITLSPIETPIGSFEAIVVWGTLSESEYFDENEENDRRFAGLFGFSYRPSFLPGFTFGVNRFTQSPWNSMTGGSVFDPISPRLSVALGDDDKDQRASITADWKCPDIGFEVYGEWARNDYSSKWRHIVRAPEHSNAYTLGFRQLIPTGIARDRLILLAEHSQLIRSRDYYIDIGMGTSGFYHHSINTQGHTHRGQILAAGIGPGSDSQTLGLDWFLPRGKVGGKVIRTSRNKNYIYGQPDAGRGDINKMNVEMEYELSSAWWISDLFLAELSVSYARNINWNYIERNDVDNVRVFTGFTVRL